MSSQEENTTSPTAEQLANRPPHPAATKYTLDGEILVLSNGEEIVPPVPEKIEIPKALRSQHQEGMQKIALFIAAVKKHAPRRQIPALRSELVDFGVSKKILSELEEMGFIQQRLIAVLDSSDNNRSVGSRAVVYFTPRGKAFFRSGVVIDEN